MRNQRQIGTGGGDETRLITGDIEDGNLGSRRADVIDGDLVAEGEWER